MPLPGSDKYRRQEIERPRRRTIVTRADDEVPIAEILKEIGTIVPTSIVTSWKVRCPWASEHKDGGVEQDCRVYATNSMHCFAMHGTMGNSLLLATHLGITRQQAAIRILEQRGMLRATGYRERMAELLSARKVQTPGLGNPAYVVQALQTRLSANPAYVEHEFETPVIDAWQAQLKALDSIVRAEHPGLEQLRSWFDAALVDITSAALT